MRGHRYGQAPLARKEPTHLPRFKSRGKLWFWRMTSNDRDGCLTIHRNNYAKRETHHPEKRLKRPSSHNQSASILFLKQLRVDLVKSWLSSPTFKSAAPVAQTTMAC